MQLDGGLLSRVNSGFRSDEQIVRAAVACWGGALAFAPKKLLVDKDLACLALQTDAEVIQHTPFTSVKEIVIEAVTQLGYCLQWASPQLRDDREVVLEAVKQDGNALAFASARCQADPEIVLAALRPDALSSQHASDEHSHVAGSGNRIVCAPWRAQARLHRQHDRVDCDTMAVLATCFSTRGQSLLSMSAAPLWVIFVGTLLAEVRVQEHLRFEIRMWSQPSSIRALSGVG